MERGTVKFFNVVKGFGFITTSRRRDILYKSNVKSTGFRNVLSEGTAWNSRLKRNKKDVELMRCRASERPRQHDRRSHATCVAFFCLRHILYQP